MNIKIFDFVFCFSNNVAPLKVNEFSLTSQALLYERSEVK